MKRSIQLLLVALTIACATGVVSAQTQKMAYVNSETILREIPEAQAATRELEVAVKGWQDEYEKMAKDLQDQLEDYQKKQSLLDPTAKAAKEKSLQDQNQKLQTYRMEKFDQREGEAMKLREKKLQPIQDKVLKAIEVVAREDGFTFVLDKTSTALSLLYADAKYDLTYKVIDRIKRGGGATKAKDTK